jgi:hypothetical protein
MAELKPKLRVDVNHNPTKKGIKVQFVLPQTLEGDAKAQATQKLQSKLNQGLEQYNLTVSQDTDVPYSNVIGFLIPIADVKLLIKNAIGGGAQAEPAPEATPAPEEPMKEIKRMMELAGINEETTNIETLKKDYEHCLDRDCIFGRGSTEYDLFEEHPDSWDRYRDEFKQIGLSLLYNPMDNVYTLKKSN